MNKSEYLIALYDALDGIPNETRTEAILEYQEYFRNELEKGRTEEEIAFSLGDPITLAYGIKQRRGYGQSNESPQKVRRRSRFPRIVKGLIITSLIMSLGIGIGVKALTWGGINLNTFSFIMGKKHEIDQYKEADLSSAKTIVIRTLSTDTTIKSVNSDKVTGHLKGHVRTNSSEFIPSLNITVSGNTITIEEKRTSNHMIGFYSSNLDLVISIPSSFHGNLDYNSTSGDLSTSELDLEELTLKLTSGDIELKNITLDNNFKLKSTSGKIDITKLNAKNANIESTSGDKKFKDITVSGIIEINTTSGNNSLENIECEELWIDSTSGNIDARNIKLDHLTAECLSGDLKIDDLEGGASLKNTSGNISASFTKASGAIDLNASSGNIELRMPSKTGFTLSSQVTSGNINCDFDLIDKDSGKKSLKGRYGNGDIPIKIYTTSGNISIKNN